MTTRPSDARRAVEARLAESPPALRDFFEQELAHARAALAEGCSVEQLAVVLREACERASTRFELAIDQSTIACRRGCSRCCHGLRVEVLAPEALNIARHVSAALDHDQLAALKAALAVQARNARQLSSQAQWRAQTACVFLDQASGSCSIYPVRPIVCRLHHSLDRTICDLAARDPEVTVPRHLAAEDLYGLAQAALLLTCEERGLDARSLELASAVEIALGKDAAERWARGAHVFDAAAFRPRDEEFDVDEASHQ